MWKAFSPRSLTPVNLPRDNIRDNEQRRDLRKAWSEQGHGFGTFVLPVANQQMHCGNFTLCDQRGEGQQGCAGLITETYSFHVMDHCFPLVSASILQKSREGRRVGKACRGTEVIPVFSSTFPLYSCELVMNSSQWKHSWVWIHSNPRTQQHTTTFPARRRQTKRSQILGWDARGRAGWLTSTNGEPSEGTAPSPWSSVGLYNLLGCPHVPKCSDNVTPNWINTAWNIKPHARPFSYVLMLEAERKRRCSSGGSIQNELGVLTITNKHVYWGLALAIKIAGMLWVHP